MMTSQTLAPVITKRTDIGLWWRVTALVMVVANTAFNVVSERLGDQSMRAITERYDNAFVPAGWAFSIWGIIYLAFIAYAVVGLLPKMRSQTLFDRTAMPLALVNLLASAWIIAFKAEIMGLSQGIIMAMVVLGALGYREVYRTRREGKVSGWALVPWSLFLAWVCVATIAQTTISFVAAGWDGAPLDGATWASIMMVVALVLCVALSFVHRDFVIPVVFGWALLALWDANRGVAATGTSADVALASAVVAFAVAFMLASQRVLRLMSETRGKP